MARKYEITIGEELDSFLGSDQGAIDKVNIEASQEGYEAAVRKEIKRLYPNLAVTFNWDGPSDYSEPIDAEPEEYADLQEYLEDIVGRVYGAQDFWVNK